MAKEDKINIELTEKQIDCLVYWATLQPYGPIKLEIIDLLNSAKAELVNQKPEFTICRRIVMDFFRKITKGSANPDGETYPFSPICGVHLKQLITFLKLRYKKKNGKAPTPDKIGESLQSFLNLLLELPDQWYIKNFSLRNINSKKDEIVRKIAGFRNGKQDDADKRKKKNDEYYALKKRAEGLLKRYSKAFKEAEISDRHGKVDFIFKGEELDWTAESDLRLLMLDLLEHTKY